MKKASSLSINERAQYGVPLTGPGLLRDPAKVLTKLVAGDHGLDDSKKDSLFSMFSKPEVLDTLLVGAAGVALTHAVTSFLNVPTPARTLLSLAGFGIGNIIYNTFNERKFTTLDESKASVKIKL